MRTELRLGVSLTALSLAVPGAVLLPQRAEAACSTTGSVIVYQCDSAQVAVQPVTGVTSLTVSDMTVTGGQIYYGPADNSTLGPFTLTLTVTNTSVTSPNYGAINIAPKVPVNSVTVTLGSDVTLQNTGGFGGLWVRNEIDGIIAITSGATITSTGSDALTATSNGGSVSIINTGTVTSTDNRGIYADGSPGGGPPIPVSVNNSGLVNAYLAGIRVIDYSGTASIQNSGTVTSTTRQGLIAWAQSGDVSIDNSGSVLARNYIGVQAATDAGNATVVNSGYIEAQRDTGLGASSANQGIAADATGNVSITNTATGRVIAGSDTGIIATTANGTIIVSNAGRVTGTAGVSANATIGTVSVTNTGTITATSGAGLSLVSGNGAVSLTNSGIVSATGIGVSLDGTTNTLTNAGTISTTGTTAVQTGNGNSTVILSGTILAASSSDTAIAMGTGSNRLVIVDTAVVNGRITNASSANMLELTGTASASFPLSQIGASGVLRGFANLTKSGTGTWVLTGSGSSLSGTAAIDTGTLALRGALSVSALTVGSSTAATLALSNAGTLTSAVATVGSSGGATAAVTVSGTGATWTSNGDTSIGANGTSGTLTVSNGGQLASGRLALSTGTWQSGSGGTAALTVTGTGSLWTSTGGVDVARTTGSTASLTISGGATARIYNTGIYTGAGATLTFTGVGTRVEIGNPNDDTQAAWLSPVSGNIIVSDGASLYTSGAYVGANTGGAPAGSANMTVTGSSTTWTSAQRIYVGGNDGGAGDGSGTLTLEAGATATTATVGIGMDAASSGTLSLTGTGTRLTAAANATYNALGNVYVGYAGSAIATISDGATLHADNAIRIAWLSGSTGTLIIGGDSGSSGVAAGTIEAPTIAFGDGTGSLVLNHTGTSYVLASAITGNGAINVLGGTTILTGDGSGFTGRTTLYGGALQIGNGGTTGSLAGNIALNGRGVTVTFDRSDSLTYGGVISGRGALIKNGAGTLTLSGANTYTGGTTISAGTLQIGDGGTSGAIAGNVTNNGALVFNRSDALTYAGVISGTGSLTKTGIGTLTLTGINSYSGGTTISAGTLVGNTTSLTGNILNNAALAFDLGADGTYAGAISGSGSVTTTGAILTLTGNNSYSGGTTISSGRLQIGNGGTSGTLTGDVVDNGYIVFNRSDAVTFAGAISGGGSLAKSGAGTLTLSGTNTYTGLTTVQGGGLAVDGSIAGNATLATGASLSGTGRIAGNVRVNGGTLLGTQTATLTIGSLNLAAASNVNVTLGAPSASPAFTVLGNLTLDGTLNVTQSTGFGTGVYRIFNYGGTLTDNGLNLSGVGGLAGNVQTAVAGQVNLLVSDPGQTMLFWNGSTITPAGTVVGGTGTWTAGTQTNWTDSSGTVPQAWNGSFAVFQGTAGTVTVDTGAGAVSTTGMQFVTSGYVVTGGALTLSGTAQATIRVGDGTSGGAGTVATIASALTGTGGIDKSDLGTLVLTGANTYTGGTTISAGRLVGSATSLPGNILNNAALTFDQAAAGTYAGAISGSGSVTKTGAGTLTLTGTSSYSGGTTISAGLLQIGDGGTSGALTGNVVNNAGIAFNRSDATTFAGAISGAGTLLKSGTGTLTLSGTNTYTGLTTVQGGGLTVRGSLAGDVSVASGAAVSGSGSVAGNVSVTGTLVGTQAATFTLGALTLASTANVNVTLGAPSASPAFTVLGNLTLDGTLNVTADSGFGTGVYRIFNYGGALTDNGLDVSSVSGLVGNVQTAVAGQVNLLVSDPGQTILFWNGTTVTPTGTVVGGTGTWTAAPQTNWTNSGGTVPQAWNSGFAVFQGAAGTVTVDTSAGAVSTTGMQFVTSGYVVTGGALTLSGSAQATIRVGDGTSAGASTVATIASALTGTGGINKSDLGTLILTGTNTYAGGTTITAGTLQIGAGGTSGSITGDVVNNAALVFNRSDAITYAGSISGTGALTQAGTGTLTLTGTSTYTGGTTISAGTLQIGTGGTSGSIAGNVTNNGTLVFNRSDAVTFAGSISGTGSLTQAGTGTLTLTGTNTYTGGTTVAAGTLVGNTTSLTGNIVNNASLVFNQTTTGTYSSVISGTGSLTKTGAGTLILIGDNTYTGGTLISQGILQIGNGGTTGTIAGDVVNNATLVFNRSGTYNFPGTITGSGAVIITGGSTVNFTGANGYNGAIALTDASFVLAPNAVSNSSYTVGTGGSISGTGTISGLTVGAGGTAAPGYSPGTLSVAGNVTFQAGSVYAVDVTPTGAHDLIIATGTATLLGGTVAVNATPGGYSPISTLTILQAGGGVSGSFASVTSNLAFLTPLLSYDANDVYLTLRRNDISFASQALTANQRAAAGAADGLGWGNPVYYALANLAVGTAPAAFDALSGEAYASASTVMLQQSLYLRDAVGGRLGQAFGSAVSGTGPATAALAPGLTPTLWMQGFGAWGNTWGNGNAATVSSDIAGVFGGADVALGDNWRVGLVGGYSRTTLDVNARASSGTIDNYDIGLYAGGRYGDLGLKAGLTYTWHDLSMTRTVAFTGYSGMNTSGYDAGTTQVFGEAGYTFRFNGVALEPFAGLAYVHLSSGNLAETGSSSALAVSTGGMDTVFSSLGLRVGAPMTLVPGLTVSPSLSLAWLHAFGDVASNATMAFASGSQPFAVGGVPFARDSALIGAGLDYRLNANAVLSASYSGQFAAGLQDNAFKGTLTVNF